jgi:acyl-coenzyme A thioesterase PaaI-like protein
MTRTDVSTRFEPGDPDFAARVRQSFSEQAIMQTLGAVMTDVDPGRVEIELPYHARLT